MRPKQTFNFASLPISSPHLLLLLLPSFSSSHSPLKNCPVTNLLCLGVKGTTLHSTAQARNLRSNTDFSFDIQSHNQPHQSYLQSGFPNYLCSVSFLDFAYAVSSAWNASCFLPGTINQVSALAIFSRNPSLPFQASLSATLLCVPYHSPGHTALPFPTGPRARSGQNPCQS